MLFKKYFYLRKIIQLDVNSLNYKVLYVVTFKFAVAHTKKIILIRKTQIYIYIYGVS